MDISNNSTKLIKRNLYIQIAFAAMALPIAIYVLSLFIINGKNAAHPGIFALFLSNLPFLITSFSFFIIFQIKAKKMVFLRIISSTVLIVTILLTIFSFFYIYIF